MSQSLWGIDLGGTKIEAVVLPSLSNPEPIIRRRIDTHGYKGYDHILGQIKTLVDQISTETGSAPSKIGFGTPGILDPMLQTMKNCNSTALNGRPLKSDLEQLLGVPVALANDANCFALAETHWGVVKKEHPDAKVVFGIIMGTGVGGGIIIDGKVWPGTQGIAGEWGHNFLDESGGPCYCGKSGCVETVLSGPALEGYYEKLSGKRMSLKEIYCGAENQTDPLAVRVMERLNHFFGLGVSVVINLLDPDIIVVGGGVGNIDSIYIEGIDSVKNFLFNNRLDTKIVKPALGDSAGVFGAAALIAG